MNTAITTLMRGAEPFYFPGGRLGCLCLHGFTANPSEVLWLGEHLAAQGMAVYGARLAGHGTSPQDLARCHWRDWLASALDGYALLRSQCEQVVVVGHSMGGILALLMSMQVEVAGLAVLASPITFPERLAHARWWRYLRPYSIQVDNGPVQAVVQAEQARRKEPVVGRIRYDRWSTAAVWRLYQLVNMTERRLPEVDAPLLLVYSQADTTAPVHHGDAIAARVSSARIEKHVLQRSGHIMTQDIERETVFALVSAFAERCREPATLAEHSA